MRPEQLCPERLKGDKGMGIIERRINPEDTVRESWREGNREAGSSVLEDPCPGSLLKLFRSINTQVQHQQRQAG